MTSNSCSVRPEKFHPYVLPIEIELSVVALSRINAIVMIISDWHDTCVENWPFLPELYCTRAPGEADITKYCVVCIIGGAKS